MQLLALLLFLRLKLYTQFLRMEFEKVQKFAGALHLVCQIPIAIHIAHSEYVNSLIH